MDLNLAKEVNKVECTSLNMDQLVEGADINIVAAAVAVSVCAEGTVTGTNWHIAGDVWDFLCNDRTLRAISTKTPAQTAVRMAYKAMQTGLKSEEMGVSIVNDVMYDSHADKYEEIKKWVDSPFTYYELVSSKPGQRGGTHKFKRMVKSTKCTTCASKSNAQCSRSMCAKCCRAADGECHLKSHVSRQ